MKTIAACFVALKASEFSKNLPEEAIAYFSRGSSKIGFSSGKNYTYYVFSDSSCAYVETKDGVEVEGSWKVENNPTDEWCLWLTAPLRHEAWRNRREILQHAVS